MKAAEVDGEDQDSGATCPLLLDLRPRIRYLALLCFPVEKKKDCYKLVDIRIYQVVPST